MTDYLHFNFVRPHIGEANDTEQLQNNIVAWLNHAFLNIGGWVNIPTGTVGYYGGDLSRLYPVDDPNYSDYQVWQAFRKDWVFESGGSLEYTGGSPIVCSGVYVGATFYPTTGSHAYAHYVDFPNGRVVFTGAISSTTELRAAFSYRLVQVNKAEMDWFRRFQFYSMRADNSQFVQFGSGEWDTDPRNRLQLPGVVVELSASRSFRPYELGTLAQWVYQDCRFYIFSEDTYWRNQLIDILSHINDKTIYMYDVNQVQNSGNYPLNYLGARQTGSNAYLYPTLVSPTGEGGHRYKSVRFTDTVVNDIGKLHPNMFGAIVKTKLEFIMT